MWRIALPCLCLAVSACGYNAWYDPPFSSGTNPNMPVGSSETMRRVVGEQVQAEPLTPEPGDIWPSALPTTPTLEDLEKTGLQPQPEQPVPGSPESMGKQPNLPPPPPNNGSSTPPGVVQPNLPQISPPSSGRPTVQGPSSTPNAAGQTTIQTQHGPAVTTGGTGSYQTLTTPGGGSAIVVPNGNGTSTIIHSDGTIETVPTPR